MMSLPVLILLLLVAYLVCRSFLRWARRLARTAFRIAAFSILIYFLAHTFVRW